MHSGWGVLVAVSGDATLIQIVNRGRFVTTDPTIPGANQPYHYAKNLKLSEAETYLANYAAASERMALAAIENMVQELNEDGYRIAGSAILLASGRSLPSLAKILASHPLIHTAEGEFFRDAVSHACERLEIAITAIRERELDEQAKIMFGNPASRVQQRISSMGKTIGPPWTKDHKTAALAAAVVLARDQDVACPGAARKSGPP
jgi:hypothetical protein